jgi:tRNA(His) 5'-end guanylyltransferase
MGYKGTLQRTDFGDRMKMLESGTSDRLMPLVPVLARLDGRSFHSFCKGLRKPFDPFFGVAMQQTAEWLVRKTGALAGYTQSDEITLMWFSDDPTSQKVFFDRRLLKMVSVLASLATVRFNQKFSENWPDFIDPENPPVFDCRVWVVPNKDEAANSFLWRIEDAKTNSIQALGQANFSHNRLQGMKNGEIVAALLSEKGINWNFLPQQFRFGTFIQRKTVVRPFTHEELERLPKKHEAITNPGLLVERSDVTTMPMPDFGKVQNRVGVLFNGEAPIMRTETCP